MAFFCLILKGVPKRTLELPGRHYKMIKQKINKIMEKERQELIDFTKRWDEAMISNDADEIAKFISDDWVLIGSDGPTPGASFLQSIRSGSLTHNRMDSDELITRIYGDTGIIISRGTSAGKYNGSDFSLYEWSTSVCLRTGGSWKCVATMLTPALNTLT